MMRLVVWRDKRGEPVLDVCAENSVVEAEENGYRQFRPDHVGKPGDILSARAPSAEVESALENPASIFGLPFVDLANVRLDDADTDAFHLARTIEKAVCSEPIAPRQERAAHRIGAQSRHAGSRRRNGGSWRRKNEESSERQAINADVGRQLHVLVVGRHGFSEEVPRKAVKR